MERNRIVYLIGPMGSGKTYIGQAISKSLHLEFRDLDNQIESAYKLSISDLFKKHGEEQFRKMEATILRQQAFEGILACGGGTPCFHDNMNWINQHGLSIYLRTSPETLLDRLKGQNQDRPLIAGKNQVALLEYITEMIDLRSKYYEQAQVIFDQTNSASSSVDDLTKQFRFFF